jgi:hypothetical protein
VAAAETARVREAGRNGCRQRRCQNNCLDDFHGVLLMQPLDCYGRKLTTNEV